MDEIYKGNISKGEIELLEQVEVFRNQYATLYNDEVLFPSGKKGQYLRFTWNAPYGVMVIARDKNGGLLLLHNFRHESRCWEWEIPKGFGEPELTPLACAQKELIEESGCKGRDWKKLRCIGDRGRNTYIFECTLANRPQIGQHEAQEAIAAAKVITREECQDLLLDDQIRDPATLFALSWCLLN